jgi:hypothetical protein
MSVRPSDRPFVTIIENRSVPQWRDCMLAKTPSGTRVLRDPPPVFKEHVNTDNFKHVALSLVHDPHCNKQIHKTKL